MDTRAALEARAPVIFEAAVSGDGVYAAIDVLRRSAEGLELIEVKSTYSLKPHFLPDVAIQVHAARAAGLDVVRATLMHLGREEACPFVHADVTPEVQRLLPGIAPALERMRMALSGPLPAIEPGVRCTEPYECPFLARCSRA